MINIYNYLDYQKWISEFFIESKKVDKKFTLTAIATAIGVQKAYLSKVTKGKAHLSSDQIYQLAEHCGLTDEELQYLLLILEYARTGVHKRKKALRAKIEAAQNKWQDIRTKLKAEFIDSDTSERVAYFLDPYSTIVHILLTIDHYRQNPERIAQDLSIPLSRLQSLLRIMERLEYIKFDVTEKKYQLLKQHLFIHKTSPLSPPHQALVRTLSSAYLLKLPSEEKQSFNLTFSTDEKTRKKITESFADWLSSLEALVTNSDAEQAFQLNYEFFPWT